MSMGYISPAPDAGTIELRQGRCTVVCAFLVLLALPVGAEGLAQDDVRKLREQGIILPLAEILQRAKLSSRGRLIRTELEREDGRLVYELEYLLDGEVWELKMDASSGELLRRERD